MAEQDTPHQGLPEHVARVGQPGNPSAEAEELDYHIPFTLRSPEMANYIATMSVREQEAFELEIAQKQERIELQKAREAEAARRAQVKRDIEQRQTGLQTIDSKAMETTPARHREHIYSMQAATSSMKDLRKSTLDDKVGGFETNIGTSYRNVMIQEPASALHAATTGPHHSPMHVLPGAQNLVFNNSPFIDNSSDGPSGIDILLDASTPDATHDSAAHSYAPRCFPGTREQYIEDVVQWAIPTIHESPLPLLWVNGAAGVGKSAVAQTSAEKIKKSGPLGASFFFSINERDKPNTFFPTIAYQLSVEFDDYRNLVSGKVLRDKTLVKKAMASQYQSLIVEPLVELEKQGKGIGKRVAIVVDGLDECEGVETQCDIIKIIAKSASEGTTPLCWAFFSRPESHIEATFSQPDVGSLCRRITLPVSSDADGDIEFYLRGSFSYILRSRGIPTTPPWPSDGDLKMIVRAVNGLFISATTVYRFIAQPGWLSLDEPLRAVLDVIFEVNKGSPSGSTPPSPFAALDAFYLLILERVPEQILPSVLLLLAIMCIRRDLGVMVLANLLRLSKTGIHVLCTHLSAVLQFYEGRDLLEGYSDLESYFDTSPRWVYLGMGVAIPYISSIMINQLGGMIEFYHKSFGDFISDSARSGRFCVLSIENRAHLADNLRRLRLDYEESYCIRNSELVLAPGVPDSGFSLSYPYQNEFGNSLIKAFVYHIACYLNLYQPLYWWDRAARAQEYDLTNFRKQLQIEALLFPSSKVIPCRMPEDGLLKCIGDTRLTLVRGPLWGQLKKGVELELEKGIMWLYPFWFNSFPGFWTSREKTQDKIESELYLIGHGSRTIFWYWEYNYDKGYYRDFRTTNLEEGKKIFRAERFDLWENPV